MHAAALPVLQSVAVRLMRLFFNASKLCILIIRITIDAHAGVWCQAREILGAHSVTRPDTYTRRMRAAGIISLTPTIGTMIEAVVPNTSCRCPHLSTLNLLPSKQRQRPKDYSSMSPLPHWPGRLDFQNV